jgi:hypothetical protein
MSPLPCWLLLLSLQAVHQAPAGMQLNVRLTTTIGSYATKVGTPVSAVLIAPSMVNGRIVLPAGSTLSGRVTMVKRVGLGFAHESAALDLEFNQVTLENGDQIPLSVQLTDVDNARESVKLDGRIQGLRATNSPCYRVSGYIRRLIDLDFHYRLVTWAAKSVITQLPEPEIYYPAGSELTLKLVEPLQSAKTFEGPAAPEPALEANMDHEALLSTAAAMPTRLETVPQSRPADITNVLLIGSRQQIAAAFTAAGWVQPHPMTLLHRIWLIRATSESHGYVNSPMTPLALNGSLADMSWEKGLNDVQKRHHIRLWRQPGDWHGQEMWVGAATRDVSFAYLRPGQNLTHQIETNVDLEREKVASDLLFTTCVNLLDRVERPDVPRLAKNGTGDSMTTDTRMVVMELNDCQAPRQTVETRTGENKDSQLPVHGNGWQRFARREVLITRNDALRNNLAWRSFEAGRWIVNYISQRRRLNTVAE